MQLMQQIAKINSNQPKPEAKATDKQAYAEVHK